MPYRPPRPHHRRPPLVAALILLLMPWLAACDDDEEPDQEADVGVSWGVVTESPEAALLAVHGTSPDNVWMVGADDGEGPVALNWDGTAWTRHATGVRGDLWWVHAFPDGPVFMSGSDAHVVRYQDGVFERLATPGLGKFTIFGLWGAASNDLYAVGAIGGRNGFIWHYDGTVWTDLPLPADLPRNDKNDVPSFFKVWGSDAENVWIVGGGGVVLHGNANDGFRSVMSGASELLFTVHGLGDRVVVVGGGSNGVLLEAGGESVVDISPAGAPLLQGICVGHDGTTWAVGARGAVYRAPDEATAFTRVDTNLGLEVQSLHAVWVDPEGGVWAVGGNVLSGPLNGGVGIYSRTGVPSFTVMRDNPPVTGCPINDAAELRAEAEGHSIARRWNDQLLNAIRRDSPRPTVHARNLFHTSIAMWDAWAAYDDTADGYLVRERLTADDIDAARREAISYAAYRVLSHRYGAAIGGPISQACFDGFMDRLGFDATDTDAMGDTARALGNRIGARVIAEFADDGARESENYLAPDAYTPANPVMVVDLPGNEMTDPIKWQELVIAEAVSQNGIPEGSGVRPYVGPHWRFVTPFALVRPGPDEPYLDIGEPPTELNDELIGHYVDVLRKTAELDFENGAMMDISPGAYGNNPLGTDDGTGHEVNPITGAPYAPQMVLRGDFTRILAEFWADGQDSETSPGHWNRFANYVSEQPQLKKRIGGVGPEVDDLGNKWK